MRQVSPPVSDRIPRWLVIVASVAIAFHLFAVVVGALAAPSGPWPSPMGMSVADAPQFAQEINKVTMTGYLRHIKLTHNYHFASNSPSQPDLYLQIRLLDADGRELRTIKLNDPSLPPSARYREGLLVRGFGMDMPVPLPQSEVVAGPDRAVPNVSYWDMAEMGKLRIKTVPQHLVPREQPVSQPSEFALLLARSFARYLARTQGAARIEILRHHKDPVPPEVLFPENNIPSGAFDEVVSNFGEFTK
jgi:hypothetical protein